MRYGENIKRTGTPAVAVQRLVRRTEKRLTYILALRLINNWICDGCPTGDDAGGNASRDEAEKITVWLNRKLSKLSPPND